MKVSGLGKIQVIIFWIALILILPSYVLSWIAKFASEEKNRN